MLVDSVPVYAELALELIAMLVEPLSKFSSTPYPKPVLFDLVVELIDVPTSTPTSVLLKLVIVPRAVWPTKKLLWLGYAY
jgi:hypothetical protein